VLRIQPTTSKRLLEREPAAVPGWGLVPGNVMRSIEDPIKAFEQMVELFSVQEFLACWSVFFPLLAKSLGLALLWYRNRRKWPFKRF
jgi:hypothetical protein